MMDKVSDLSIDRVFWVLGSGNLSVTPEKVIVYGLFFIAIVIFVNWLMSITVIVLKPFLYAGLMLAILRPEFIQNLMKEETVVQMTQSAKSFFVSFTVGLTAVLHLFHEHFNRSIS